MRWKTVRTYGKILATPLLSWKTIDVSVSRVGLVFPNELSTVHNNPELFTEQIAGIVMDFTLVKLNEGFTIEKLNILKPSLKMTLLQPLLTTSRPLDILSSEIILIF